MKKKLNNWNQAEKNKADKRRAAVRALREQGKTFAEIGLMLGVSYQRVQQLDKAK